MYNWWFFCFIRSFCLRKPPLKGEVAFAHVSEQKPEGLKREGGLIAHVSKQKTEGFIIEAFSRNRNRGTTELKREQQSAGTAPLDFFGVLH